MLFGQLGQAQPDVVSWDDGSAIELSPAGKGLSQLRAEYERPLLALTVLVTLVLLITCTNVGNLLVVRNSARRRELTMRVALGARRTRLMNAVPGRESGPGRDGGHSGAGRRAMGRVDHPVDAAAARASGKPGLQRRRARAGLRDLACRSGARCRRVGSRVARDTGRSHGRAAIEPGQHADAGRVMFLAVFS